MRFVTKGQWLTEHGVSTRLYCGILLIIMGLIMMFLTQDGFLYGLILVLVGLLLIASKIISVLISANTRNAEDTNLKTTIQNRAKALLEICERAIEEFECDDSRSIPSCKEDLMASIKNELTTVQEELSKEYFDDRDYLRIAHTLLANKAFDLLASGNYHIYYGELNPLSCASNLMKVYQKSMEYGVNSNIITGEERREQYEYLLRCISQVG